MKAFNVLLVPALLTLGATLLSVGCGSKEESPDSGSDEGSDDDEERPPDGTTGAICEVAEDCFADVAEGELAGEAMCLDRVDDGYCTHECEVDEDCCAAEGECPLDLTQVCSPFESTGLRLCFLSCEDEDLERVQDLEDPPEDESEYCQRGAGSDFICRSSGGGAENRKVCVPGDCGLGADCAVDADCSDGLTCLTGYLGGYCTTADCTSDEDCPEDSLCAEDGDSTLCVKTCVGSSDCSFCRADGTHAECVGDATLLSGVAADVCWPLAL